MHKKATTLLFALILDWAEASWNSKAQQSWTLSWILWIEYSSSSCVRRRENLKALQKDAHRMRFILHSNNAFVNSIWSLVVFPQPNSIWWGLFYTHVLADAFVLPAQFLVGNPKKALSVWEVIAFSWNVLPTSIWLPKITHAALGNATSDTEFWTHRERVSGYVKLFP